jgi:LysR family hydrogen peroxide-inducible transcriptional activator
MGIDAVTIAATPLMEEKKKLSYISEPFVAPIPEKNHTLFRKKEIEISDLNIDEIAFQMVTALETES